MLSSSEFFKHNFQSEKELKNIVSSENLSYYKGFGLSPNVRLFVFKQQTGAFSINLMGQALRENCIAIVPPGQLHFLSPINCSDFICIEVPKHVLIEEDFDFITRLVYPTQKFISLDKMSGFDYHQFKALLVNDSNHLAILQLLKSKIEKAYPNKLGKIDLPCKSYIEIAFKFESLIKSIENFTLDQTILYPYTNKLGCSEKTLYRACYDVFRVSPQDILKHQLLLTSISLLFNEQYQLDLIAKKLGYSSVNGFMKFIKSQTNTTAVKIRKQLQFDSVLKEV